MAIDISAIKDYVQDYPTVIGKMIKRETVLPLFVPHTGAIPGIYRFRLFETTANFQSCCTIPTGNSKLETRDTEVVCIEDGDEYCETDLAQVIRDARIRFTAGNENAGAVEELIVDQQLAVTAEALDMLIFQGDKTNADNNLNRIDGLIKQAIDKGAKQVDITSGDIFAAFQRIILSITKRTWSRGVIGIFVGDEVFAALTAALINKDLYHFNPGTFDLGTTSYITFPGYSNIRIYGTRGLNDTGYAIVTPLNNIHWITNLENDYMSLSWNYTEYHQKFYWRLKFILGILFGLIEDVLLVEISDDVITTMPTTSVTIVNPLGTGGGVLVEQHAAAGDNAGAQASPAVQAGAAAGRRRARNTASETEETEDNTSAGEQQ